MLDKLLFATRRFFMELGDHIGSWRLSIVLMVLAVQYYLLLAIWSGFSPGHVVRNIASLSPFLLLYALLLANTAVCLWRRIPTLKTWPGVGSFMFHGAFFLIAIGFLATALMRQEATVWVAAGETYTAQPEQFLSQSAPRIMASGVPQLEFTVERIDPEFWRDELLFTRLEANLQLPDGQQATTRINRPLWFGPATFLRLSGFGYSPRYEVLSSDGDVLDAAFVKLNLFPPGQRDHFVLPGYPHRCYLEVLPDLVMEDGEAFTRSLNLRQPGVLLSVFRGRLDLGGALLESGEAFEFEGLQLRFPEIRYWGEFSIVYDPGALILFCGFGLGLAGLIVRVSTGLAAA
jgi:hypothetical protein